MCLTAPIVHFVVANTFVFGACANRSMLLFWWRKTKKHKSWWYGPKAKPVKCFTQKHKTLQRYRLMYNYVQNWVIRSKLRNQLNLMKLLHNRIHLIDIQIIDISGTLVPRRYELRYCYELKITQLKLMSYKRWEHDNQD